MRTLGSYVIIDELGRGGMGIVYRARGRDGRVVAVKLLPRLLADRDSMERFGREVRLLGSLDEEQGFVPLLDSGSSPSGPFFVMPLLEGGTLRQRLADGPFSVQAAVDLGTRLGRALGAAHAAGIVHRDLKPENILFTAGGLPLVSDLGLAKHFARDDTSGLTISLSKTGEFRGTIGYMAPEQVTDAKDVGPAADVFALGAMLYECLTGESPFQGENPHATLAATVAAKFVPLARKRRDVPPGVAAIIERALAKDPMARHRDGAELAQAFASKPAPPRARSRLPLVLALLFLAGAATTAAIFVGRKPSTSRSALPPPPPAAAAPGRSFPAECRGFLESSRMKLVTLLGSYSGGHGGSVAAVAWSPRGDLVASAGADRRVVLWTSEGSLARALPEASRGLTSVAFTPDGRFVLAGTDQGSVEVWSADGEHARSLPVDEGSAVLGVFVSKDGKLALAASRSGVVRAFDLGSGEVVSDKPPQSADYTVFESRHATEEAVLGGRSGLLLLDGVTRNDAHVVRNLLTGAPVTACRVSGDGTRSVSADASGGIAVWDLESDKPIKTTHVAAGVTCVAVSRNGTLAVAGGADGSAHLVDLATGAVATFESHEGAVRSAAFSPDDRRFVTASEDGRVRAWEVGKSGEVPRKLWPDAGHTSFVNALAPATDGRLLSGSVRDGTCRIWEVKRETEIGRLRGKARFGNVNGIAVSSDGRRVAVVTHDRMAHFFDLETREETWTAGDYFNNVLSTVFMSDGRRAVTGSDEGLVRIFDLEKSAEVGTARTGQDNWIRSVAVLPGDERVAACGWDGSLRIFTAAGAELSKLSGVEHSGLVATLGPGRLLWSWGDGTVGVVDAEGGAEVVRWQAHEKGEPRLAVFPGGKLLATSTHEDATVRIWDLASRSEVDHVSLASAQDEPFELAVSDEGRLYVGTKRGVVLGFEVHPRSR